MKRYNINIGKIITITATVEINGVNYYINRLTELDLVTAGYLPIRYEAIPNRRYYTLTETGTVIGNEYVISYTPVARPLAEVQDLMLKDLNEAFMKYGERPRVDSTLGYFVDGARIDKENFEIGKKHNLPQVVDADNIYHNVTSTDYDIILNAIELNGISLWQTKQTKRAEILALSDVVACALYEATPYDVVEDILDPITGLPTGSTQTVTKYKNNVKEW